MHTVLLSLAMAFGVVALSAAAAAADHNKLMSAVQSTESAQSTQSAPNMQSTPPAPERSSVDVDLKLGLNGFRLGARVFGKDGYSGGAWVNGETRPDGFSVDGRVERDGGKSWNFKLNADIDEALRRAMKWWGGSLTDL
jgi:hypothetical protein